MSLEIRRIYEDAEIQLLRMIAKRLMKDPDVTDWMSTKLSQLSGLLAEANRLVGSLNKQIPKEIERIIELAYLSGAESSAADLKNILETIQGNDQQPADYEQLKISGVPNVLDPSIGITGTIESLSGINTQAIKAMAAATTNTLITKHVPIVRGVDDIYRQILVTVGGSPLTGIETRLEATQRALNMFADKGIKVFIDKAGNAWDLPRYAEMTVRTQIGQSSVQGHAEQMAGYGLDLVQVSDHKEECPLCRPWEGKILSLSGNTPGYKTLAEATGKGLFHTYCGHRLNTYIEGITKPLEKTEDPDGYEEKQRQREIERKIRKWKKRESVAITPNDKSKASQKIEEWTGIMDQFIEDTGRKRKREREQITKAR